MTLLGLLVLIAIAGVLLWGIGQFPIDATLAKIIKVLVIVVVAIAVILFVARMFGANVPDMRLSLRGLVG
jgi:hypothetical protein